jgi:hypothetical protein
MDKWYYKYYFLVFNISHVIYFKVFCYELKVCCITFQSLKDVNVFMLFTHVWTSDTICNCIGGKLGGNGSVFIL